MSIKVMLLLLQDFRMELFLSQFQWRCNYDRFSISWVKQIHTHGFFFFKENVQKTDSAFLIDYPSSLPQALSLRILKRPECGEWDCVNRLVKSCFGWELIHPVWLLILLFFFFSGVGRSGNYSLQVRFGPLGVFCIVMSSEQFSHLYSAKCWGEWKISVPCENQLQFKFPCS